MLRVWVWGFGIREAVNAGEEQSPYFQPCPDFGFYWNLEPSEVLGFTCNPNNLQVCGLYLLIKGYLMVLTTKL